MPPTITKLRTAFGNYPYTATLKNGEIKAAGIELEFEEIKPVNRAFTPMARSRSSTSAKWRS